MTGILGTIFQWLGYAVYNATAPTVASGANCPLQCDANGNLLVNVGAASGGGGGGGGYATIEANGSAVTQRAYLNVIGASVVDTPGASPPCTTLTVASPNYITTVTGGYTLLRAPWTTQPVSTTGGAQTIVASSSAQEGDVVELPDADVTYGTNALTFNGGGHNVQDPYNLTKAMAATWVSPAGFSGIAPAWQLLKTGAGVLYWKAMRSC